MMTDRVESNFASVNGINMYYEIHGTGSPLIMQHGSLSNIDTDFSRVLSRFAQTHQVIAIEQQGHGHTADIDRPLSFVQMAEDTVTLLHLLNIEQADFFGYSMGGGIATQIAIHHPEMVRKFVFAGAASYSPEGFYPGMMESFETLQPELLDGSPFQQTYARIAPYPENWYGLIAKIKEMDIHFEGWTPEQIRGIQAPALLLIGDSDIIRPEHTMEMFRLLGGGDMTGASRSQLAVLPGTTHISLVERADWLVSMTEAFLNA